MSGMDPESPGRRGCSWHQGSRGFMAAALKSLLERVIRGSNWDHLTLQMLLCRTRQEDRSISTIIH